MHSVPWSHVTVKWMACWCVCVRAGENGHRPMRSSTLLHNAQRSLIFVVRGWPIGRRYASDSVTYSLLGVLMMNWFVLRFLLYETMVTTLLFFNKLVSLEDSYNHMNACMSVGPLWFLLDIVCSKNSKTREIWNYESLEELGHNWNFHYENEKTN